jgi:two-component system LytT family response regulator
MANPSTPISRIVSPDTPPAESGQLLRVVVADDERPARAYLRALLHASRNVQVVGEATDGAEAVKLIERERPDLALLDLQMPELDGLDVVRLLRPDARPLVAFVTAYDSYAIRAFDVNAIDYLLKPVESARLQETLTRVRERLTRDYHPRASTPPTAARLEQAAPHIPHTPLRRIPVRERDAILFVPVDEVAAVVADGELLNITTHAGVCYTITYRLKDLERRLDTERFVRISRGALINLDAIARVSQSPAGTYIVILKNRQQLPVSRLRARLLRDGLFRL